MMQHAVQRDCPKKFDEKRSRLENVNLHIGVGAHHLCCQVEGPGQGRGLAYIGWGTSCIFSTRQFLENVKINQNFIKSTVFSLLGHKFGSHTWC